MKYPRRVRTNSINYCDAAYLKRRLYVGQEQPDGITAVVVIAKGASVVVSKEQFIDTRTNGLLRTRWSSSLQHKSSVAYSAKASASVHLSPKRGTMNCKLAKRHKATMNRGQDEPWPCEESSARFLYRICIFLITKVQLARFLVRRAFMLQSVTRMCGTRFVRSSSTYFYVRAGWLL